MSPLSAASSSFASAAGRCTAAAALPFHNALNELLPMSFSTHTFCSRLNSVIACRYAWECQTQEGGWGLDGVLRDHAWKLRGIVNGIDYSDWSPSKDNFLSNDDNHWGYRNYDAASLKEGKAACKAALQRVSMHAEVAFCSCQGSPDVQEFCFAIHGGH